jgi:hypothetical protein
MPDLREIATEGLIKKNNSESFVFKAIDGLIFGGDD